MDTGKRTFIDDLAKRHSPAEQIERCVAEYEFKHGKHPKAVVVSSTWAGVRVAGVTVTFDPLVPAGQVRIEE